MLRSIVTSDLRVISSIHLTEKSMKPGTKLKSAVCDTEVMVIRGTDLIAECGGAPKVVDSQRVISGRSNAGNSIHPALV